jgi:hypothetical protein
MTPERFGAIVDAYGADPRRWPAAERTAASDWARHHRQEADALLAASAQLDAWLGSDTVVAPDAALIRRVVASAPGRRAVEWRSSRAGWWWSGAAFAGIGLVGGLAGAFAVSFFLLTATPPGVSDAAFLTTGFGGVAADWSGE